MKRLIIVTIMSLALPMAMLADSYSSLWKKVQTAENRDMPKDKLAALTAISEKALVEREWGQLLKAELEEISTTTMITPDSLKPMVNRFERKALSAASVDPVLAAVYNTCLGVIYRDNYSDITTADSAHVMSQRFFDNALTNKQALADARARDYEPLAIDGNTSRTFNDDMLHVVAFEAHRYMVAHDWYRAHDNRPAACLAAYYQIEQDRFDDVKETRKSKYMARLDSLINVYRDLPEAGEVAIEHFNFMDQATDASSAEKIDYIDYALRTWPTWPRMTVLKNARSRITLPSFHAQLPETIITPGRETPIYITSLINLQRLQVTVTKLNMTGGEEFRPDNSEDMKLIRSMMAEKPVQECSREYLGLPDYLEVRDTITLAPLAQGVYLVEFITDNNLVPVERTLLHVTNLRLIDMDMPDKQIRLIVADATTGRPVEDASIHLKFRKWEKGKEILSEETLTTDDEGEVTFRSSLLPYRYRVTTSEDNAMEWQSISSSWMNRSHEDREQMEGTILTDRAIYRPGQIVKASLVAYRNNPMTGESRVMENEEVEMELTDLSGKVLDTKQLTTDEWGVASAEFPLPQQMKKNGMVYLTARFNQGSATTYIRVEEYKRPTFTVTIDDYKGAYKTGDTITVRGWAKTYSGVPVQNAKVEYGSRAEVATWWRMYNSNAASASTDTDKGETTTADDGSFEMCVPIRKPDTGAPFGRLFFSVDVNATVTSLAGESREGRLSLPLSDKPATLLVEGLNEKVCFEQLPEVSVLYLNNAGEKVDASFHYNIDGGQNVICLANDKISVDFSSLAEGEHVFNAYCNDDSVSCKFVLFSMDDKRPVLKTDDWYHSIVGNFTRGDCFSDGEPVRIQVGTTRTDQTVYYAIVTADQVIEEGSFVLNNENHNRSFTYDEAWGDGLALCYAWVRDGKLYTHKESIHKPEKSKELKLEWSTFRDKVTPGQKETWTLNIKNPDGTPAKAHLVASIYDKSLDALQKHNWHLSLLRYMYTPFIGTSQRNLSSQKFLYGEQSFRPLAESQLELYHLAIPHFWSGYLYMAETLCYEEAAPILKTSAGPSRSKQVMLKSAASPMAEASEVRIRGNAGNADSADERSSTAEMADVPVRGNMEETAAFLPDLVTDKNGNVAIRFTLPESLTTWRMLGLTHDKGVCNGLIASETVARKQLMVQPNMPRFLREGDETVLASTITNITDSKISGNAMITITNAATEKVVYQQKKAFAVEANNTTSVKFDVPASLAADMYVVKVVAQSKSFSDGEQHNLPVLSQHETIVTTKAVTQAMPGKKTIDLTSMFGKNTSHEKVSIEYANNPAWFIVDALPEAIKDCADNKNAISLSTGIYAATLANGIKKMTDEAAVDTDTLEAKRAELHALLRDLQNTDGSFSWWPQMPGNAYITLTVARNLVRLDHLLGKQDENQGMINGAMTFVSDRIAKEVKELKKWKEKDGKPMPSELAMDYLYVQSLRGAKLTPSQSSDIKYLMNLLHGCSAELSIYGKANLAVAFSKMKEAGDRQKAEELIESALQYSVATEDMGRYFDTPKAQYSWRNYKIPTETAAIEALQVVRPQDMTSVAEMRQWLLNEKRTQKWDTPINTTSAIYAFLSGNLKALDDVATPTRIMLDGKTFTTSGVGKGLFSTTQEGKYSTVTFDKTAEGMSWGAVYTEALQKVNDVEATNDNQLSIERELLSQDGKHLSKVEVGQKVRVRITVKAQRDMDFVEIIDKRAACLEPLNQLSGYRRGYYASQGDNKAAYYIEHLAKGREVVIDTDYYVDRAGTYQSGLATVSCAYAPEFSARTATMTVVVK